MVLWRSIKPSRINIKKKSPFHHGGPKCKIKNSRDAWITRQFFRLGVQNKAGQMLTEFCQENALVIANTLFLQHKRQLYMWLSPDGQHRNQIDYILPKMENLYTVDKTRPRADCGSDHELLIAKFRLKLKKIEKTTRPFRYDLNQIPYDDTVEVRNRFKI